MDSCLLPVDSGLVDWPVVTLDEADTANVSATATRCSQAPANPAWSESTAATIKSSASARLPTIIY